ncbi:MAG: cyclic nucleotide-binding domain-containing protein [Candidatus Coatesbacteria bacterium]|nr:cyclic nucleotide-binding domain-containing protein [Candidatus Coatesbacteria bacterium]
MERVLNQNLDLLKYLTDEEIEKITAYFKLNEYPPDQIVFDEGSKGDSIYIIKKGHIQISKKIENDEIILSEFGDGMFFGEIALLDEGARSAAAKTLRKTELYVLFRHDFTELMTKEPAIACKILLSLGEILCDRIRKSNENLSTYVMLNKAILDTIDISKVYIK